MNSKEEDFCPNYVQEFGLRTDSREKAREIGRRENGDSGEVKSWEMGSEEG